MHGPVAGISRVHDCARALYGEYPRLGVVISAPQVMVLYAALIGVGQMNHRMPQATDEQGEAARQCKKGPLEAIRFTESSDCPNEAQGCPVRLACESGHFEYLRSRHL